MGFSGKKALKTASKPLSAEDSFSWRLRISLHILAVSI